jgi:cell division protein FtsB
MTTPPADPVPEAERPKEHELKTWPEYFDAILDGRKTFEYRRNDRSFRVGDTLLLREWEPSTQQYLGREGRWKITYLLPTTIAADFVVLGLESHLLLDLRNRLASHQEEIARQEESYHTLAQAYAAQAEQIATLQARLDNWRRWARFVYKDGGPVTGSDSDLQKAVCETHDAEIATLQAENARLTAERDALSARVENLKFDMNLVGAQLGISSREEIEPAVRKLLAEIDRLRAAAARQEDPTN